MIDKEVLFKRSSGFTGAEIKNFINIAALNAVNNGREELNMKDLNYSLDRVIMGNLK